MTPGEKIAMRIGSAILIVAWLASYALWHDSAWSLILVCIVLVIMPASFDPAILIKQAQSRPSCFNDYRRGQDAAERDCEYCPHLNDCQEATS